MGGQNYILKKRFLFEVLLKPQIKAFSWLLLLAIGLFPTIQYAQPINLNQDSTSTIITVPDPNLQTQVVSLDLCDSLKHIYIRTNYNLQYFKQRSIKTIRIGLKDRSNIFIYHNIPIDSLGSTISGGGDTNNGTNANTNSTATNSDKGFFELEWYNVHAGSEVYMDIQLINTSNTIIYSNSQVLNLHKEKGIIDVTDHLGDIIDQFMIQHDTSIMTYFCGKRISQIELLAFFKDYFNLSDQQMCDIIRIHNISMGSQITGTTTGIVYDFITTITCIILNDWEQNIKGGGGGNNDNECLCNMIRTKADALSVDPIPALTQDNCKTYTPQPFENHYLTGKWLGNDEDLLLLGGKMGAAKGEIFYLYADGCDKIPDVETVRATPEGYGMITFRSVCVDPATLAIPEYLCKNCKKEIELTYKYSSIGEAFAKEWDNVFCDEKVGVTLEEFATLIIENNGQTSIADSLGYKMVATCDANAGWNLDSLINNGEGLYNAIENISGISGYIEAAKVVAGVIKNVIQVGCSDLKIQQRSMGGSKIYILNPGQRFRAMLYSDATYKGKGQSSVMAWAKVLSAYYISAVLKTIPDSTGSVPDYCECEAIAAYTWGSMDGFTPSAKRPRDKDKQSRWPDFAGVYDNPPMGAYGIKQLIGSFIGTAGEWGDKFENAGCCAVVIPCHADCVYITGCPESTPIHDKEYINIEAIENINNTYVRSSSKRHQSDEDLRRQIELLRTSVEIYPNPSSDIVNIRFHLLDAYRTIKSIEMYNTNGVRLYEHSFVPGQPVSLYQVDIAPYESGMYFIRTVFSDTSSTIHRFVKL